MILFGASGHAKFILDIFEAHRRHLYQLLANEKKISHLKVSTLYAAIQFIINVVVIFSDLPQIFIFAIILLPALFFLSLHETYH